MNYQFHFQYLACQTCKTRINCSECKEQLEQKLKKMKYILGVDIQILKKSITISSDKLTENELLDILENAGIFTDSSGGKQ